MESFDSIAKTDTNESMAKKDSTDLITEVDSNQDVESLGVDSRDSIPGIYSNKKFDADSVHHLKEFEKEVSILSLEPSLRVDERQCMLIQNNSSQLLLNDARYVGVWLIGLAYRFKKKVVGKEQVLFRDLVNRINGRLGDKYKMDSAWCESVDHCAEQKKVRLENELSLIVSVKSLIDDDSLLFVLLILFH
ncbi:hypothetical protein F2Q68_00017359 [Brassica cretica]|uniref:Uncharacterized protein n=1 Tax=Brassica cretica TaxID=69181 RepID=A0A8S9HF47_BRACR|nr:hypothetical protein F2Q68_00017359 [Brassica cretica]